MDASSQIAERRNREFERLRGPRLAQAWFSRDVVDDDFNPSTKNYDYVYDISFLCCMQALQRLALKTIYNTLDFAQTGLIASVFLFKVKYVEDHIHIHIHLRM